MSKEVPAHPGGLRFSGLYMSKGVRGHAICTAALALFLVTASERGASAAEPDPDVWADVEVFEVTGDSAASLLSSTTGSVVDFDSSELQAMGVDDISDLDSAVPNLEIVTISATTPTLFIRGVGLNDFSANAPGAIAIYRDGVPINAPAIQLGKLFDVESVEVLRGPQGTGNFRNASGGVIAVNSRKPRGELAASLTADFGNYGFMDYQGALEVPILPDLLSARFAFRISERNGYIKNGCGNQIDERGIQFGPDRREGTSVCNERSDFSAVNGDVFIEPGLPKNVNDEDNWSARATFRLEPPDSDTEILASVHGSSIRQFSALGQVLGTADVAEGPSTVQGYIDPKLREIYLKEEIRFGVNEPGLTPGERLERRTAASSAALGRATEDIGRVDPWENDYNLVGIEDLDSVGGFAEVSSVFDTFELRAISSVERYERSRETDFDMSSNPSIHLDEQDDAWQWTQSFEIQGELEQTPLRWNVGGFYLGETLDYSGFFDLRRRAFFGVGVILDYEQKLHSMGLYTDFSWDLGDDFTLDTGIRFNLEHKTFDLTVQPQGRAAGAGDDDELWSAPTGGIGLTYHFNSEVSIFAKYTRGWKPGHFNASVLELGQDSSGNFVPDITVADPETIDSFELGARAHWLDGRIGVRAALFYYKYSDYQVFLLANEPSSPPQLEVINANDAQVYGAELDLDIEPVDGLQLNLRMGWLESQFLDFTDLRSQRVGLPGGGTLVQSVVVDYTGNRLPNSPKFKVSGTAQYAIDLGSIGTLTPRYDFSWTDKVYFDPSEGRGVTALAVRQVPLTSNAIAQKAYVVHNARLSYAPVGGVLELSFWVRNLTNKAYKTYVADASVGFSSLLNFVGEPRTYGGSLSVSF